MKAIDKDEFENLGKKTLSRSGRNAAELVKLFIDGEDAIMEIEELDFGNEYDFTDRREFNRARCHLNYQVRAQKLGDKMYVATRQSRMFLVRK